MRMLSLGLDALRAATFRANPSYELVPLAALPAAHRLGLAAAGDAAPVGVLRPRGGERLSIKAVDRGAAELFAAAARAAPLPVALREALDDALARRVAALVLDHVLEVEHDGRFLRGAAAHALLLGAPPSPRAATTRDRIARLSLDAMRLAAAQPVDGALSLSRRLYGANALPITPAWRRRLPSSEALAAWLGLDERGSTAFHRAGWSPVVASGRSAVWAPWARRSVAPPHGEARPCHKLYVSARPEVLPDVLRVTVEALGDSAAAHFKVGRTLRGILRPDKLVAYFFDHLSLRSAVGTVRRALAPYADAAQGTPFTAALEESGILSWGFDPPTLGPAVPWRGRESWRLWVTNRLSSYLLAACANGDDAPGLPAWRFALDRLALDGVDVESWTPRFTGVRRTP